MPHAEHSEIDLENFGKFFWYLEKTSFARKTFVANSIIKNFKKLFNWIRYDDDDDDDDDDDGGGGLNVNNRKTDIMQFSSPTIFIRGTNGKEREWKTLKAKRCFSFCVQPPKISSCKTCPEASSHI